MGKFGWCFIGAGGIAHTVFNDTKEINIVSVYSRTYEKAVNFAKEAGAAAYKTFEEAVTAPGVDAVYIAVPHVEHFPCTMKALELGKPVLCEKPIAVRSWQIKKMIEEARKSDLFLMEAMWVRFNPIIKTVRSWIEKGEIGEVRHMTADFSDSRPVDFSKDYYRPEMSGGGLLDMGVYPLAFSRMVYGEHPADVHAFGKVVNGVDTRLTAVLEYSDNRTAAIYTGLDVSSKWEAVIYGSKGVISVPEFWKAREATLIRADREILKTSRDGCVGWGYQMRAVEELISSGAKESMDMPLEDSLSISQTMDALLGQVGVV